MCFETGLCRGRATGDPIVEGILKLILISVDNASGILS